MGKEINAILDAQTILIIMELCYSLYFSGGLAVGFFGNEEGNKGIQSTVIN